jgi:hypothetical protein
MDVGVVDQSEKGRTRACRALTPPNRHRSTQQALEASLAEALVRTATLEQDRAALEGRVRAMGDAARAALQRLAAHRSGGVQEQEQEGGDDQGESVR